MSYSKGHPIRPVAGRLVLDFMNTADWSKDNRVVAEHIEAMADIRAWSDTLGIGDLAIQSSAKDLRALRYALRIALSLERDNALVAMQEQTVRIHQMAATELTLEKAIVASGLSICLDRREFGRLKLCPGENCGWMFIDESKNRRRRWCSMEVCGNRAKAKRFYRNVRAQSA